MIRYLLEFVKEERYADDLLNGRLFMHCAKYYHDIENRFGLGRGDLREGSLFPNTAIYRNIYFPIYCTYMIKDEDIIGGHVLIDNRIIDDFDCKKGYAVIIPFEPFEEALTTADTGGYRMDGVEVWYSFPTQEDIGKMFSSDDALNLRVKHPYFRYQKEYRLIVFRNIYKDNFSACLLEERTYSCYLKNSISGFAIKVPISIIQKTDAGYLLDIHA